LRDLIAGVIFGLVEQRVVYFQVREFHPLPKSKGLSLWKVEKVSLAENWIRPICLFNKDNSGDFQGQQFSSAYDVSVIFFLIKDIF